MNREDVRRWAANHAAAAARERQEARRQPLSASEAFTFALSLLVFDEMTNGSPFERPDPVSRREDEAAWEQWAKLRRRWR